MKYLEKFYKWCHFESRKFALAFLCAPVIVMALEKILAVESLFLPSCGFFVLLGLFFLWADKFWWKDVEHLF